MLCLLKTSRDLQISFAAVMHLVEALSQETLLTVKLGKPLICLVGTLSPNDILNIIKAGFVLQNVNNLNNNNNNNNNKNNGMD
jgi:hypothetical protein